LGEIWAEMLFEVYWEMVENFGFSSNFKNIRKDIEAGNVAGNIAMLFMTVDAMKLQPCRPTFTDARDAILKSDEINFNGKYKCSLWRGFAKRGLGIDVYGRYDGFSYPDECKK
jgi:extracellular elastinolytic metalloproteinase